jgi:hypothetical protein
MAKRNRDTSPRVIERRIQEGRGQGELADYRPWLSIHDVASEGLVTRVLGWTTGRAHHFLSRLELTYFYVLDWTPSVRDIREQYPLLPLEQTLTIAEALGMKHPTDPQTRHPIVMTTDFLVSVSTPSGTQLRARAVKPSSSQRGLSSARTLEKLEIERRYWATRSVDWGIVTEREIPAILAANVRWVHESRDLEGLSSLTGDMLARVRRYLEPRLTRPHSRLSVVTDACDDVLGLEPGTALQAVKHLIASSVWSVDMSVRLSPSKPLALTGVLSTAHRRAASGGARC